MDGTSRGSAPLRAEKDVERGRWVLDALGPFGGVDGIVPPVFEAAVRVLHPSGAEPPLRWREVAEREGTLLHPLAQWGSLVGGHPEEYSAPRLGLLPLDELAAVAEVLALRTSTPDDCLAAFWEGFGVLSGSSSVGLVSIRGDVEPPEWWGDTRPTGWEHPEIAAAGFLELPQRDSLLFALDVRALADPGWAREAGFADASGTTTQTPLALWPEDRAWYLASEVDFDSTVIAGSRALADDLLRLAEAGRIEALLLPAEVDLTSTGDRVNTRRR
jgi:hypothetical protein